YKKSCEVPTPIKNYLYEYKLIVEDKTTCPVDWSSWSKNKVSATNLVKVETKDEKQIKEYKEVSVPVTVTEKVKKQVSEKYISKYITEVVKTGTKDVKVGTTTKTTYEKVKVGTVEYATGEIGIGTKVPADTEHVKYKILSTDTTKSCSYCTNETRYTWEIYTVEPVYDVVEKKEEVPVYETINVYETRKTPVYDIRTVEKEEEVTKTVYETKKVPVYENVTYYRYKECKFEKGYTDVVWTKNKIDSNLILRGYKFTGNVKQA
ncbi:MAG: hypothetical protein Q4E75_04920, partial [bacterium]|nr:hypothetical protein [bacterium]